MKITKSWKKAAWYLSAAAVISLASFGIYNTVNAVSHLNQPQTAGYISAETSSANNNPATGSGCNPYGCAACTSCWLRQSPVTIEIEADNAVAIELR